MPIFCRKNVHPLKNTVLRVISIKCFMRNLSLDIPEKSPMLPLAYQISKLKVNNPLMVRMV